MDKGRFRGKVALVTGGNSGMGLAVAAKLVAEGAHVVLSGRNAATVERAARELGDAALGVVADVGSVAEIDRLIERTRDFGGGRLDVVFANAGSATFGPVASTTEAQWDELMSVNLKGVYFTVQKALPLMGEGGAIVLNASVAAAKGNPAGSLYGASKAGVRSLGRTLAAELVGRGIRVNVVSPGPIETPLFGRTGGMTAEAVQAMKGAWAERNPMRRFGTPEEVAAAVLFLASDEASFITGVDLLVDGGLGSF
ncbi:MAG TPA: glucose 1-dehydrogenase [Caldimonas sp.]|jgi:NAD(P)-dependent dehydrogenase (short-subunit alcohol dehydrogenase family)|nr:glucose 1-dehydrogenase [Caldimonas sp.]HEX2539929.1 glucose 1-dehydrogenase [Caldimonas sp.]